MNLSEHYEKEILGSSGSSVSLYVIHDETEGKSNHPTLTICQTYRNSCDGDGDIQLDIELDQGEKRYDMLISLQGKYNGQCREAHIELSQEESREIYCFLKEVYESGDYSINVSGFKKTITEIDDYGNRTVLERGIG